MSSRRGHTGRSRSGKRTPLHSVSTQESQSKSPDGSQDSKESNKAVTEGLLKYSADYFKNMELLIDSSRKGLDELEKAVASKKKEQSSIEDLEKQLVVKHEEIRNLKDQYEKEKFYCQQMNRNHQPDIERKMSDNKDGKETFAVTKGDYDDMKTRLEKELRRTRLELNVTKSRLSKFTGETSTDSSKDIPDLSDINRPTKLAERYKQLYDNQWTDAFEVLEGGGGEEDKIILILLTLFTKTKEFCEQECKRQMEEIQKVITQSERVRKLGVPYTVVKYIKDCRKASAADSMKEIYEKYKTWLSGGPFSCSKYASSIHDYTAECFEICWLMAIQDPPVMIASEPRQGETIKSELYSTYTISGKIVDFLVWPALLLHAEGPVLTKGVVQPSKRPQSAPAVVRSGGTNRYTTEHDAGHETFDANKREDVWSSRKSYTAWSDVNDDTDKYRHDKSYEGRDDYANGDLGTYKEKDLRHQKYPESHHRRGYDQTHITTQVYTGTNLSRSYGYQYGTHVRDKKPYTPSNDEVTKFLYLNKRYESQTARALMGTKYDLIQKYFKA